MTVPVLDTPVCSIHWQPFPGAATPPLPPLRLLLPSVTRMGGLALYRFTRRLRGRYRHVPVQAVVKVLCWSKASVILVGH